MPANFSGALLKQPSGRGNKAASPRAMPFPPNLMEEACTPGLQIDNEHENDDEHDCARQKSLNPVIPPLRVLRFLRVLRAMPSLQLGGRGPYFRQSPTPSSLALLCWAWDAERRANAAVRRQLVHRLAPIG
jgi:hypothetical protein